MKNILRLLLFLCLNSALNANVSLKVMANNLMEQSAANRESVATLLHMVNRSAHTGAALTPKSKIASQAQQIAGQLQQELALVSNLAHLSSQDAQ